MTRAQAIKLLCSLESGKSEVSVGNMREVWARLTDQIAREWHDSIWEETSSYGVSPLLYCLQDEAERKMEKLHAKTERAKARAARAAKGKKR